MVEAGEAISSGSHNFRLVGFNESSGVGPYQWWDSDGPDSKYFSFSIHGSHEIKQFKIPGKDKRNITMRTTDVRTETALTGFLYDRITVVQNCVTQERFQECKTVFEYGGPYTLTCPFGTLEVYCVDGTWTQEAGYPEPPDVYYADDGSTPVAFVGKWDLTFIEYND